MVTVAGVISAAGRFRWPEGCTTLLLAFCGAVAGLQRRSDTVLHSRGETDRLINNSLAGGQRATL